MSKNGEIFLSLGAIITLIGTSLYNEKKHKIWKSALTVKQAKPGYEHCSYYRSLRFWVLISVNNIDVTGERGAFIENYYFPNLEKIGKKGLFFFSFLFLPSDDLTENMWDWEISILARLWHPRAGVCLSAWLTNIWKRQNTVFPLPFP